MPRPGSVDLFQAAVESAYDGVLITDTELDPPGPRIIYVNPAFTRMTGYTASEVLGASPRILQGPRTSRHVLRQLRRAMENGEPFEGRLVNYRRDGTPFDLEWRITPVHDDGGVVRHFLAIQRDVTRETEQLRELRRHSDRDPLTGALNRRGCEQALQRELARGDCYGVPVSLVRIDIDRLKAVNEVHGVAAGDAVLRQTAALIDDRLRRTDSLGRWGGSEFIAILPHTEEAEAHEFAEALLEDLRATPFPHEQPVTASIGVAEWRADDDAEGLLARAGQAAHAAKRLGRDRVELAD